MEILKVTKFYWRFLGILEYQFSSACLNMGIVTIQRVSVFCCLVISIATSMSFFVTEAKQLNEISESFVFAFTHFIMLAWHSLSVWKSKKIVHYLDDLQTQICKSNFVRTTYVCVEIIIYLRILYNLSKEQLCQGKYMWKSMKMLKNGQKNGFIL